MGEWDWDVVVACLDRTQWFNAERTAQTYARRYCRTEAGLYTDPRGVIQRLKKGRSTIVHLFADPKLFGVELLSACRDAQARLLVRAEYGRPPACIDEEPCWQLFLPGSETPPGLIRRLADGLDIPTAWAEVLGDPSRVGIGTRPAWVSARHCEHQP